MAHGDGAACGRRQSDGNEATWDKIVRVPWRKKNDDDAKMGEVVMRDKRFQG